MHYHHRCPTAVPRRGTAVPFGSACRYRQKIYVGRCIFRQHSEYEKMRGTPATHKRQEHPFPRLEWRIICCPPCSRVYRRLFAKNEISKQGELSMLPCTLGRRAVYCAGNLFEKIFLLFPLLILPVSARPTRASKRTTDHPIQGEC